MRLSKNFTLAEFERSETAVRRQIPNSVPYELLPNLQRLVDTLMQPIRDGLGPVSVSSGYRSPALNKAIGGSARSQHMQALAADFNVSGMEPLDVCHWIEQEQLPFDQLIHEFGAWVHVSTAEPGKQPRRQTLTIDKHGTRPGLHEVRP